MSYLDRPVVLLPEEVMVFDPFMDDIPRSRSAEHEIGQELSNLSLFELEERVTILQREIVRIQQVIEQKKQTQAAADAFFKS